ncbi:outer membrane beta-barrel protein [Robertkochia aurantiaca]|uniref:outer membrane beta-barrel protein n=1 Tax=Robertkochia aurantiaca TaxID=2873700 RepID=UPI001CCB8002|nr:outer membrane beta-barrel protein [Robertkochia sp. 3YJGBD-33]
MKPICLLLACLSFCFTFSQEYIIKGRVIEDGTETPLEASTIYAESLTDSTLVSYTISEKEGDFELALKTRETELNLFMSYNGYKTVRKKVALDKQVIELGAIAMELQAEQLEGVELVGQRVPIQIKKDTLEFNANSFKTRPDATVEDVLKKLPGVQVDSEGNITVNGKPVNRVLVNGQVFFDSDPKVATRSLPKEVIEKIQVTDTKTREQEFTGDSGDGENKTINLTVKKDKNKGMFGRITGGYGTDERYQGNGIMNYFNDTRRVSVLASSNNINSPGFSTDEVFQAVAGSGRRSVRFDSGNNGFSINGVSFGQGQGITTSTTVGGSYADAKRDVYETAANYFFSNSESFNQQRTSRENILPSGNFFTDTESDSESSSNAHSATANLEFDLSETFQISVQPEMNVNSINTFSESFTESSDENQVLLNRNRSLTTGDGQSRTFSNRVDIFKRLDTIGQYFRLTLTNRNTERLNENLFQNRREVFGDQPETIQLNQLTEVDNAENSYGIETTYRLPLTKTLRLEFEYEYQHEEQSNNRSVFDFDETTGAYSSFNELLSSDFEFTNRVQRPSIGLNWNSGRNFFSFDAVYQRNDITNSDELQRNSLSRDYGNLLFTTRGRISLGKTSSIFFGYFPNVNIPGITQLQPVPDVSNPLNIVIGNPDLSPSVNHRMNLNFNNYDWRSGQGVFVYAFTNYVEDEVVAVTTTDEDLLRTTEFTNVDGNLTANIGMGFSKQIKKDTLLTVSTRIDPSVSYQRNISFNNGLRLSAKRWSPQLRLTTTLNWKELVELEPGYNVSYNDTRYSLDNFEDINFIAHTATLVTTTYWPENIVWGNDINYTYNSNVGPGFDKDALLWNMSVGVDLFKKRASLKLIAYDLLNQNINTRRTTGPDFIQDTQGTVLRQYFMLTATFKFDQFGGKRPGDNNRFRFYRR